MFQSAKPALTLTALNSPGPECSGKLPGCSGSAALVWLLEEGYIQIRKTQYDTH